MGPFAHPELMGRAPGRASNEASKQTLLASLPLLSSLQHQMPRWEQDVSSNSSGLTGDCTQLTGGSGPEARCSSSGTCKQPGGSVGPTLLPSSACLLRGLQDTCNQDPLHS